MYRPLRGFMNVHRMVAMLVAAVTALSVACAPKTRHAVMSIFFDGVPTASEAPKPVEPVASHTPATAAAPSATTPPVPGMPPAAGIPPAAAGSSAVAGAGALLGGAVPGVTDPNAPLVLPESPLQQAKSWDEALGLLPRDIVGGVDWVKALKEKLALPLAYVPTKAPQPPFTLDTLVPGVSALASPPLDLNVEIVPAKVPFYKVVFPHSSHTMWLNCSSCHPGFVGRRPGMAAIFSGEYCGMCHGKVSFSLTTSCARCHVNVAPADDKTIEADLARAQEAPIAATPELVERGKTLYMQACAVCHGEKGDRNGPLAVALETKPRDFTKGKFRFRSTSDLPTDYDIFRVITRGVMASSMPSFSGLPFEDRFALVQYVKTFSPRFEKEEPPPPIPVTDPPPFTPELIEQGKQLFVEAGCHNCHGDTGKGDGGSAKDLKDDWGDAIKPFDFTSGRPPKHGPTAKDMFRAIMTGLQGTPMPAFGEVFEDPQQVWSIVAFGMSLGDQTRGLPTFTKGDILFPRPMAEGEMPPARFPHWFHRVRFRCAACHPGFFVMKRGANEISMDAMRQGRFCANCHNGIVAWQIGFPTCVRCHAEQ